ncbi:unnamed protein product [Pieris macdunnoughi]|uniref:Uncharacterized protein n=1 Tax=Pieris macdunnoughi TaxID=345717 RepID=A0A821PV45_9NEOP|nr:unnamed protein product [Pieris macdunnoughi]
MLGFILRTSTNFTQVKTLKTLYFAYVKSNVEYASQVWNPQYAVYNNRIELIQKKFIRHLQYKDKTFLADYLTRCNHFHILPLSVRREIADITYLINLATGKVDCPELLSKLCLRVHNRALKNMHLLYTPKVNTNYRGNSFMVRAASKFNSLTCDIDLFASSVGSARRAMTSELLSGMNDVP